MLNKKTIVIAFVILFLAVAFFTVWYSFFDTIGLSFYDREPIAEMVPYSNQIYLIDTEGKVFVTGGHEKTGSRKYRNAELKKDNDLGCFSPVLIFDKSAKSVLPYRDLCALIITENGSLYNFVDFELSNPIAENVNFAFYSEMDEKIYYIDNNGGFYDVNQDELLCDDVKKAYEYNGELYVLKSSGELGIFDQASKELTEIMFESVLDFAVLDTSERIIDGKYVANDPDAIASPLFILLTNDGKLYAKGTYNHLSCGNSDGAASMIKTFENWTLIDEGVETFASSEIGTVYTRSDGAVCYYGFDSISTENGKFKLVVLEIDNATSIYASKTVVCVRSKGRFYIWGNEYELVFDRLSDEHGILTGKPVGISSET